MARLAAVVAVSFRKLRVIKLAPIVLWILFPAVVRAALALLGFGYLQGVEGLSKCVQGSLFSALIGLNLLPLRRFDEENRRILKVARIVVRPSNQTEHKGLLEALGARRVGCLGHRDGFSDHLVDDGGGAVSL